jgi:hypothetical protein
MAVHTARSRIIALAQRHGVTYQATYDDALAAVVTRLSGDAVVPDAIEDLAVALKRAGVITGAEMVDLLSQYLNEEFTPRTRHD